MIQIEIVNNGYTISNGEGGLFVASCYDEVSYYAIQLLHRESDPDWVIEIYHP